MPLHAPLLVTNDISLLVEGERPHTVARPTVPLCGRDHASEDSEVGIPGCAGSPAAQSLGAFLAAHGVSLACICL